MVKKAHAPRTRLDVAARLTWPVLAILATLVLVSRSVWPPPAELAQMDPLPWHIAMAAYGVVGAIVVNRRSGNVVGWLFLTVGLFDFLAAAIRSLAVADMGPAQIAGAEFAAWVQSWIWSPSLGALALLIWVFPTGRPLQGLWRLGAGLSLAATLFMLLIAPIFLWPLRGPILLMEETLPGAAGVVTNVGFFTLMLSALWGVISLAARFRRAKGDERQQLKWFFYAACVVMVQAFADIVVLDAIGVEESMTREVVSSVALAIIPVSAAIAVLKYRLYDIDRLINRTVVYGGVTAALALAYLAVIGAVRLLTLPMTENSNVAVAASTLIVAALFQPLRQRVQRGVDRRFNRARYDAAQTVQAFSSRLRDQVELESLASELLGAVATTVQPARTTLWLNDRPKDSAPT